MIPDGEKIVSDYLRDDERVSEIVDRRIVGKTPEDTDAPWVRLTQIDAPSTGSPHHLIEFYFQLDCYAGKEGGQPEAKALGAAVFDALAALDGANHQADDAVVTACRPNLGLRRPDDDVGTPARERVISTAFVTMHPTPAVGS